MIQLAFARKRIAQRRETMEALRGRRLTAKEQLTNLFSDLATHDSNCATHKDAGCTCGANEIAANFSKYVHK